MDFILIFLSKPGFLQSSMPSVHRGTGKNGKPGQHNPAENVLLNDGRSPAKFKCPS
ncbi:hypothetical protein LEMLEM_LOCUS7821 [Lemmus lemmus]